MVLFLSYRVLQYIIPGTLFLLFLFLFFVRYPYIMAIITSNVQPVALVVQLVSSKPSDVGT